MGSYLNTYLGPYVVCAYRNETKQIRVYGCVEPTCREYQNRSTYMEKNKKFCSTCASLIGESAMSVRSRPSPYSVMNEAENLTTLGGEASYKDNTLYLGSNRAGPGRSFHSDDHDAHLDLTTLDREAEMAWFLSEFATDIALLKTAYDDVQVRWGFHLYYH